MDVLSFGFPWDIKSEMLKIRLELRREGSTRDIKLHNSRIKRLPRSLGLNMATLRQKIMHDKGTVTCFKQYKLENNK